MIHLKEQALGHLRSYAPEVFSFLKAAQRPCSGYAGSEEDEAFATEIEEGLKAVDAYESSSKDFDLMGFVVPPGEGVPGESSELERKIADRLNEAADLLAQASAALGDGDEDEEEDDDEDSVTSDADSKLVMLGMDAGELAEAQEEDGDEWWEERWGEEEYQGRLKVGALMNQKLSDVYHHTVELEGSWAIAFYQGTSKSGATVGVLGARFDAD